PQVNVSPAATVCAGTTAPDPTRQSLSTAYGPMVAPSPTVVAPNRCTPGCSVTSRPRRTESSTNTVSGATIVTPASSHERLTLSRRALSTTDSSALSLAARTSSGEPAATARTGRPASL